jgi:hypothetical protein
MRVRLCWRRESGNRNSECVRAYSATQLLAKIKNNDWIGSLEDKISREGSRGVTHMLFVQRDNEAIKYAALVPLSALVPIWIAQRDISTRLIQTGKPGRRKKNHAMNGHSSTLWLQDDCGGKEVADALWGYPGVSSLTDLPRLDQRSFLSQIWIAVSVYLLIAIIKKKLNLDVSFYTLLQILSFTIFEKMPLQQAFQENGTAFNTMENRNQLNLYDS